MAIEAHLETLEKKHHFLQQQLDAMAASPSTDDLEIAEVKRKKLLLKDEIEKFKQTNKLS